VGLLLRRASTVPVTTPLTGVIKTSQKHTNHTWFASFFHVEHEYTISFQQIISENQKRSEQVFKIKNQTQDSVRNEANKQPRKHPDMKGS
jgi:hypothetical protein